MLAGTLVDDGRLTWDTRLGGFGRRGRWRLGGRLLGSLLLASDTDRGAPRHHARLDVVSVGAEGVFARSKSLFDLDRPGSIVADDRLSDLLFVIEKKDASIGIAAAGERDLAAIGAGVLIIDLADPYRRLRPLRRRGILIGNHRLGLARHRLWLGLRRSSLLGLRLLWCGSLLLRHGCLTRRLADGHIDGLLPGQPLRPLGRGGAQCERMVARGQRLVEHDAPGAFLIDFGLGDLGAAVLQRDGPARLGTARDHAVACGLDAHHIEARHRRWLRLGRLGLGRFRRFGCRLFAGRHLVLGGRRGALMPIEINPCRSEGDHADHCHD